MSDTTVTSPSTPSPPVPATPSSEATPTTTTAGDALQPSGTVTSAAAGAPKKQKLLDECERIQENCLWNSSSHFNAARVSRTAHGILGALPFVLGGIGGWKFLTDPATATHEQLMVAGALSVAAGVIGSVLSFWNLEKAKIDHFTAGTRYKTLENDARRAREIHADDDEYSKLKERVMSLAKRYDELGETSAPSHDFAFWLARTKIEKGVFKTAVDLRREAVTVPPSASGAAAPRA